MKKEKLTREEKIAIEAGMPDRETLDELEKSGDLVLPDEEVELVNESDVVWAKDMD